MTDTKYKVGDRVRLINVDKSGGSETRIGDCAEVTSAIKTDKKTFYKIRFEDGYEYRVKSSEIEIISSIDKTITNMKEKFIQLFLSEPTKSLRKSGLINGDNIATDEGVKLYVSYLMTNDTKFNADVVQAMLKKDQD